MARIIGDAHQTLPQAVIGARKRFAHGCGLHTECAKSSARLLAENVTRGRRTNALAGEQDDALGAFRRESCEGVGVCALKTWRFAIQLAICERSVTDRARPSNAAAVTASTV